MNEKLRNNQRGQALIENALLIPIIVIIITMIFWFARILLTRQQLLMAARYGTDMIYYTHMDEAQIRGEIRDYLCGESNLGRKLDPDKLTDDRIRIKIYRHGKGELRVFAPNEVKDKASSVELFYEFDTPLLFSAWDNYLPGPKLRDTFTVSAR